MHEHQLGERPVAASPFTVQEAHGEAELRSWLDIRNRVVTDVQLTEEDIQHSIQRNPTQIRLIAAIGGEVVGAAMAITDRLKPGGLFMQVKVLAGHRRQGIGTALYRRLSSWGREHDGEYFQVGMRDTEPASVAFWEQRGFHEVEREFAVVLDLANEPPGAGFAAEGVEVVALCERPDLLKAVYAVGAATWNDIPTHAPTDTIPFDEWVGCVTTMPGCSLDHLFVALHDGQPIGYAQLELPPGEPGTAWNGFTGVLREHRGRGVARQLKLHQVDWARKHGLHRICTSNHQDNAAMRSVNRSLGYRPLHARLLYRGPLADDLTLPNLGWNEHWQECFAPWHDTCTAARVTRIDRGACSVHRRDHADELRVTTELPLAVGDWVALHGSVADGASPVAAVLPRRSSIARNAAGGVTVAQVVAANVDVALIVCSLEVPVNMRRIERFLAITWQGGIKPVIVLSKADLVPDRIDDIVADVELAAVGVDVVAIDSLHADGVEPLMRHLMPGVTAVLLGQSGVGKSTLVNRLLPTPLQAVHDTRGDGKGRHTTTHRELIALPSGALLIDTPGVRELQLWDAQEGLARTFEDIEQLLTHCRFNDCGHGNEPGCAVTAALADGRLEHARLSSYHKLQKEARWLEVRQDKRARSEERKANRHLHKELRHNSRQRRE